LPDGTKAEQGTVIIWSAEDEAADTNVPRLEASGADRNRIHIVGGAKDKKGKRAFDPSKDVPGLLAAIKAIGGAALIVVDPIVLAVAKDSHKNAETRRDLQPLSIWQPNLVRLFWASRTSPKDRKGASQSIV
jgi:putative DNA primase/helicase